MKVVSLVLAIFGLAFLSSCDKENKENVTTEKPTIISLTSDKTQIKYGSSEPAKLKCTASGEDLNYIWEVDFGDLFIINSDGSEVQFTASPCCMGEKRISCEVSNGGGKVTKSIIITIIE
ncbi:MAG: hypothetical protein P8I82_00595 [Flavobacteriales bacterium]|nr:hypothetical protein [Flavobacteriales bacterium]